MLKKQELLKESNDLIPQKSKTIDKKLGKILRKRLYGKRRIGLKKLATEYDLSSKGIRRWLDTKSWGKYRVAKFEIGLSEKNLNDRKIFYKRVQSFWI